MFPEQKIVGGYESDSGELFTLALLFAFILPLASAYGIVGDKLLRALYDQGTIHACRMCD